jgi:hypothetical protein
MSQNRFTLTFPLKIRVDATVLATQLPVAISSSFSTSALMSLGPRNNEGLSMRLCGWQFSRGRFDEDLLAI